MTALVVRGDAECLPLPSRSVDAIATDPPYNLDFMGRAWDRWHGPREFQGWCDTWAREALRVLKPGGHLIAFGGARTFHRLVCGIEDAGFEVRDSVMWIYGQGFPKSLDVSKAVDREIGAERQIVGVSRSGSTAMHAGSRAEAGYRNPRDASVGLLTAPATEAAREWSGWGTALKPAHESILVARKPLIGTVAANVLRHGTGALNIDACRVAMSSQDAAAINGKHAGMDVAAYQRAAGVSLHLSTEPMPLVAARAHDAGRWPPNVVVSHAHSPGGVDLCADGCVEGCPVLELDRQSGPSKSRAGQPRGGPKGNGWRMTTTGAEYDDAGGASRMFPTFRFEAKAPSWERPRVEGVAHETVKPLGLMRWLVRLVCPPGGLVLDPFAGSGTTGEAALREGMRPVLVERSARYLPLIESRVARVTNPLHWRDDRTAGGGDDLFADVEAEAS